MLLFHAGCGVRMPLGLAVFGLPEDGRVGLSSNEGAAAVAGLALLGRELVLAVANRLRSSVDT